MDADQVDKLSEEFRRVFADRAREIAALVSDTFGLNGDGALFSLAGGSVPDLIVDIVHSFALDERDNILDASGRILGLDDAEESVMLGVDALYAMAIDELYSLAARA